MEGAPCDYLRPSPLCRTKDGNMRSLPSSRVADTPLSEDSPAMIRRRRSKNCEWGGGRAWAGNT